MKKLILIATLVSAVVAAPIQAKGPKASHPAPPASSTKCQAHAISYEAWGKLVSGSLTHNADGTYSGTLTVHVTGANHHAKSDKNTDKVFTLTNAHLNIHGANPASLAVGSRVHLKGTMTTLAKNCDHVGFAVTITVAHGDLKAPTNH